MSKCLIIGRREVWSGEINFPRKIGSFEDIPSVAYDEKVWRERRISFNEEVPDSLLWTTVTLICFSGKRKFCWDISVIKDTEEGYTFSALLEMS